MAIFLCEPDNLQTAEKTNPLASGQIISKEKALNQFRSYLRTLAQAGVPYVKTSSGALNRIGAAFDICYSANWGAILPLELQKPIFILSKMKSSHRQREAELITPLMKSADYLVKELRGRGVTFEGQADVKVSHGGRHVWIAYGPRTSLSGARSFAHLIQEESHSAGIEPPICHLLHMTNPAYYHLDLSTVIYDQTCIARKNAFAKHSLQELQRHFKNFVEFENDAEPFALNLLKYNKHIFARPLSKETRRMLSGAFGKDVSIHEINISEIEKGGGSLKCISLDTRLMQI
jgi:N-dimethylarginine dimethylaminohydrolase